MRKSIIAAVGATAAVAVAAGGTAGYATKSKNVTVSVDGQVQKVHTFGSTVQDALNAKGIKVDPDIAKVSVVGVGMRTHAGVAAKMFEVLAREGINIEMISTSEIKISVVIDAKYTELAVRVLHKAFIENNEEQP